MKRKTQYISSSAHETITLGKQFAQLINHQGLLALYGELGSGKTTFVQGLAKGLGIKARIISPTFIVVRHYEIGVRKFGIRNFYHIDLYRIKNRKDLDGLGLTEILNDPQNVVAIEWPEKVRGLLPQKRVDITFEYVDEEKRRITIGMEDQLKNAIKILKAGGIVVFPTDTAFAVGCRLNHKEAVERLFKIRKRPKTQAVSVLVDTVKMAQDYLLPIPKEVVNRLIEPYWPGALTIILPSIIVKVPALVRGSAATLGVRIPNHPIARAIVRGVGVPILGPSANFHGAKTPYAMADLDPEFLKQVDFVVAGECVLKQASTVIDCSTKPWRIVRKGVIVLDVAGPTH